MRKKATYGLLIASCYLLSTPLQAGLLTRGKVTKNEAHLIRSTDPGAKRFMSVGKLISAADCTATLFSGEKTPPNNSPALIITAGHCIDINMDTNQVIVGRPVANGWKFIPGYFIDRQQYAHPVAVNRILYATMKQADIAVLQLDETYGELAQRGFFPLKLKQKIQAQNQAIELIHIPVIGVDKDKQFLRQSLCHIKGHIPLLFESNMPWIWKDTFSVDCAGVAGGTSGSPVVEHNQSRIIGILNTTVTQGLSGCGLGRPCEVHHNHPFVNEGSSYFIPVDVIAQAITDEGKLNLSKLEKKSADILQRNGSWATQSKVNGYAATWNITVDDNNNEIRYKTGAANIIDCTDSNGYGDATHAVAQPLRHLAIPKKEGIYLLCVISHKKKGRWTTLAQAAQTLHVIDDTPPSLRPEIEAEENDNDWKVSPGSFPWELGEPRIKYGPLSSTDCDLKTGYRYYLVPTRLAKSAPPWRYCTYGTDQAGNAGPVNRMDFGKETIVIENNHIASSWKHPLSKDDFLRRTRTTSSIGAYLLTCQVIISWITTDSREIHNATERRHFEYKSQAGSIQRR